jgi:hypothetical protein
MVLVSYKLLKRYRTVKKVAQFIAVLYGVYKTPESNMSLDK